MYIGIANLANLPPDNSMDKTVVMGGELGLFLRHSTYIQSHAGGQAELDWRHMYIHKTSRVDICPDISF